MFPLLEPIFPTYIYFILCYEELVDAVFTIEIATCFFQINIERLIVALKDVMYYSILGSFIGRKGTRV